MENKDVRITFKSRMFDTDEQFETSAKGVHYVKNGKHYVMYTEESEDGLSVRNILKFDGDSLKVSKIGTTKTNMYYKSGHKHVDVYRTPLGEYDMCIETEEYVLSEKDSAYEIIIGYNLELGGSHVSKCRVEIVVEY